MLNTNTATTTMISYSHHLSSSPDVGGSAHDSGTGDQLQPYASKRAELVECVRASMQTLSLAGYTRSRATKALVRHLEQHQTRKEEKIGDDSQQQQQQHDDAKDAAVLGVMRRYGMTSTVPARNALVVSWWIEHRVAQLRQQQQQDRSRYRLRPAACGGPPSSNFLLQAVEDLIHIVKEAPRTILRGGTEAVAPLHERRTLIPMVPSSSKPRRSCAPAAAAAPPPPPAAAAAAAAAPPKEKPLATRTRSATRRAPPSSSSAVAAAATTGSLSLGSVQAIVALPAMPKPASSSKRPKIVVGAAAPPPATAAPSASVPTDLRVTSPGGVGATADASAVAVANKRPSSSRGTTMFPERTGTTAAAEASTADNAVVVRSSKCNKRPPTTRARSKSEVHAERQLSEKMMSHQERADCDSPSSSPAAATAPATTSTTTPTVVVPTMTTNANAVIASGNSRKRSSSSSANTVLGTEEVAGRSGGSENATHANKRPRRK